MRPRRSEESPTCSGLAVGSDCAAARPTEKIRARHTTTLAGRSIVQASSYSGCGRHSNAEGRGCQCEEPRGLDRAPRSEEHTSGLQSQSNLVWRPLLHNNNIVLPNVQDLQP